jgi:uncharacterized membrane protein
MQVVLDILSLIGFAVVLTGIIALIVWIGGVATKIWRVAKHYHDVYDPDEYWATERNLFSKVKQENTDIKKRLYVAERDGRNAIYRIGRHVEDYKHTKTAKKIAIDKERKELEKEHQHDRDVRGC